MEAHLTPVRGFLNQQRIEDEVEIVYFGYNFIDFVMCDGCSQWPRCSPLRADHEGGFEKLLWEEVMALCLEI